MAELGDLPIKNVNGAMVYIRDVAQVHDGNPPQTNIVHVDGGALGAACRSSRTGPSRRSSIIDGIKERVSSCKTTCREHERVADRRPVLVRDARP